MSSKSIMEAMYILVACGSLLVDLKAVQAQDGCPACIFLATTAQNLKKQGMSPEQIFKSLEQQCDIVPAFKTTCLEVVEDDGIETVELIFQGNTPDEACHGLGLC